MNYSYKRQNIYLGAFYFIFAPKKFIKMAVIDGMARNLEADDQHKRAEKNGEEILAKWEEDYKKSYTEMASQIRFALWSSFGTILLLSAISITTAFYFGHINISLSLDHAKCITYIGSSLVGWATLLELGNDFIVWDSPAFPQLTHKVIFKTIFIPGVFLVLLSILL